MLGKLAIAGSMEATGARWNIVSDDAPGDELARLPATEGRTVLDQVDQVLLTFFFHVINI